jgi:hypothetical protein
MYNYTVHMAGRIVVMCSQGAYTMLRRGLNSMILIVVTLVERI